MPDIPVDITLFVLTVTGLALAGSGLLAWAKAGGPRAVVLSAWAGLIALCGGIIIASIALNPPAKLGEAYALTGLICLIIYCGMTPEIWKKSKVSERNRMLAEDL